MKASKKLIGASVALVAALAVSVGSTYAWFTAREYVTIDSIEASVVTASTDLQVMQVDKNGKALTNWSYDLVLDKKEITPEGFKLDALTTDDAGATLYTRDNYEATQPEEWDEGTNGEWAKTAETTNDKYIEFYLRFRSPDAISVALYNATVTSPANTEDAEPETDRLGGIYAWDDSITAESYGTAVAKGQLLRTNAANAARVAFFEGNAEDVNENFTNPMGLTSKGVWDPQQTATAKTGFFDGNLARDYEAMLYGVEDASTLYADPDAATLTATSTIVELAEGEDGMYYAYICVKVWIEGRDGDCFNYILGDSLNIKLGFNGVTA